MPKVSDKSKPYLKVDDPIRTVIAVTPPPDVYYVTGEPNPEPNKAVVARTSSNKSQPQKLVKLGHRRVRDDGEVTYKKFKTPQLIGSIQLGLEYVLTNEANIPDRDLLLPDFMSIETVPFTRDGLLQQTPAHNYSEFRFRIYAAHAFRVFRRLFEIDTEFFLSSLCSEPMVELSAAGASGSIFYVTRDDNFICKTVQHKEAEFLQKLLPGYYMNLKQNPRTLLPKFFGLYCYCCNAKNVRILVMNNLLPSGLKMHQKFDLKGSTYKRKASKREREKNSPTFKDLDFMEMHSEGIFLQPDLHASLRNSIQRDCTVLESFKIMDYSLLIGIHNVDLAARDKEGGGPENQASEQPSSMTTHQAGVSDAESSSTGTAGHPPPFERQGSFQDRQRIIAHSTALESITVEVDSLSLGAGAGPSVNTSHHLTDDEADHTDTATDCGLNNVWGGIPAKNKKGENLLLFIGIIDILQSYRVLKKMEHFWKSLIHDGDTVSVHRPGFYAKRFQSFLFERVFKEQQINPILENTQLSSAEKQPKRSGTSFRRGGHLRRTLSKEQEFMEAEANRKESTVTVIKIGSSTNALLENENQLTNEVNLPYVLRDKVQRQNSRVQVQVSNAADDDQAEQETAFDEIEEATDELQSERGDSHTPLMRNITKPFLLKDTEDKQETGSVITMTSDERVQIFVPSPQGTPYNTITKGSNTTTTSIGAANLAPLFVPYRMPTSESYRSLTPLNMSSQSPINANESGSRMKESLSSTEEQRTGIELDSLPLDGQPVSISQIHLEHVSSEETDE